MLKPKRVPGSVSFSADGQMLATGGGDGLLRLWDVATGRQRKSLDGASVRIRNVAFSPDHQRLAATGNDDDIRIWELSDLALEGGLAPAQAGQEFTFLPGDVGEAVVADDRGRGHRSENENQDQPNQAGREPNGPSVPAIPSPGAVRAVDGPK
jgi:WD domain, G-beta repeat